MVGRDAAVHIMFVLMTSSGVVAAAAKAPAQAPIAKSSCNTLPSWNGDVLSACQRLHTIRKGKAFKLALKTIATH